jgi:DNA-directed RNA polymerase specialized sigma24 family protein
MESAEFNARYRSLVVAGCEWRAFELSDPEQMADRVFARMANRPATLRELYSALQHVVDDVYRRAASQKPILAVFQGPIISVRKEQEKTFADLAGDALRQLPTRETAILQEAYWDELDIAEIAELRGWTAERVEDQLAKARAGFQHRLARKGPTAETSELAGIISDLKPGTHRR